VNPELLCPACGFGLERTGEDTLTCRRCREPVSRSDGVWTIVRTFRPGGFPESRIEGLAGLDEGHFWSEGRDLLALDVLGDDVFEEGRTAVDLGCGTGRFAGLLAKRGLRVYGVDGHRELLARAASGQTDVEWVHAPLESVPLGNSSCDLVVTLDVLEHVEPGPFLCEVARILKPGGRLLLSVPATPALWSRLDEAAGHRCRYTLALLREEVSSAGLELQLWTHYQFLLFPLVAFSRWIGRRREVAVERRHSAWVGRLLGSVNRLERRALGGLSLPIGSSLIARCARVS